MTSPKNILIIAPLPPPTTGQSVACEALYICLQEQGHKLQLTNLSRPNFKSGLLSTLMRITDVLRISLALLRMRKTAELIYFTPSESVGGNLKDLLLYAALGAKIKHTFIHLHGGAGMRLLLSPKHPWLARANGYFLRRMDGVIVLGERLKSIYAGTVEEKKLHTVVNFAPDSVYISQKALQEKLRPLVAAPTETANKPTTLRLLFLSNHLPGKGHDDLLAAFMLLPEQVQRCLSLDFAGGFDSQEAQNAFLARITGHAQITYHGVVLGEKKCALLAQAHIFCLPSYYPYEGQPISILEAYAAGCAVLTTDHSGIFDIFSPGENGIEVAKNAPASIAQALLQLYHNPQLLRRYAIKNARLSRTRYRKPTHLSAMLTALGLAQGSSPNTPSPATA